MKVWNAKTIDEKVLLLIYSYELFIEWMKEKKEKTCKTKEAMKKTCGK